MSQKPEPTTAAGWHALSHDLAHQAAEQQRVVEDCDNIIKRSALARLRGEPSAVSASADAAVARTAALTEIAALEIAIGQAKEKLAAAVAAEQAAAERAAQAEYAETAAQIIAADRELCALAESLRDAIETRAEMVHGLIRHPQHPPRTRILHGPEALADMLGAALANLGFGRNLLLIGSARAAFDFVARDCNIFNVDFPSDLEEPPPSVFMTALNRAPREPALRR